MKNFKTLFSLVLVFALSIAVANAQTDILTEGFAGSPDGWTIDNSYFGSNNHGLYEGSSSVKLKSSTTTVTTPTYNLVDELFFYYYPKTESNVGSEILIEVSIDGGENWNEVHTTYVDAFISDSTWHKDSCYIEEATAMIRFTSTPNASMYLDDVRLTQTPTTSDNADLDSIYINGGFITSTLDQMSYDVDLYYTSEVIVGGTSVDAEATVTVTQASDIFSATEADRTATISIKSKDESVTKDYAIVLNIDMDTLLFETFTNTTLYPPFYTSTAQFITSTPKDGQNTLPVGDASYGFVNNSILEIYAVKNVATISFKAALRKFESDFFDVELYKYVGADSTLLYTLKVADLTTAAWVQYSIPVNETDSTSFKFITMQTSDNASRIFVDDIALIKGETSAISSSRALGNVTLSPNPAQDMLFVSGVSGDFGVSIFNLNGTLVNKTENINRIDISGIAAGAYLVRVDANQASSVQKLIVK